MNEPRNPEADLAGVVRPVRLGPAVRRRNLDDLIGGDT